MDHCILSLLLIVADFSCLHCCLAGYCMDSITAFDLSCLDYWVRYCVFMTTAYVLEYYMAIGWKVQLDIWTANVIVFDCVMLNLNLSYRRCSFIAVIPCWDFWIIIFVYSGIHLMFRYSICIVRTVLDLHDCLDKALKCTYCWVHACIIFWHCFFISGIGIDDLYCH